MPLRDDQKRAVSELRQAIRRSGSAVYVSPTGSGKTVVAGEIARLAAEKGSRTLFLIHRRELVRQVVDTLAEACPGMNVGIEAAGWASMPWAMIQIASVQSLARRAHDLRPDLIITDEAHHVRAKTWEKVLGRWPKARRIGLTATPERLDGKGLGQYFAEMVLGPSIPELVAMKALAPIQTLRIPSELRLDGVALDRKGEYKADEMAKRVTSGVVADGVKAYLDYGEGRPAIFFGVHRDHSRRVCEGLRAAGVRAEHVDGEDHPARRDRIMKALKTGGLDVVGNCDLISEGFDAPRCDVAILGSATRSVTRYLQKAGRPMRYREYKVARLLDLTGVSYELGLPDEVREWSLEDGEIREPKKAHQRPRECPQCMSMFYGRTCPYCHHAEPLAEVNEVETELEEARSGGGVATATRKGNRRADLWREVGMAKRAGDPRKELLAVAERRGYKPGWAEHILRAWGR